MRNRQNQVSVLAAFALLAAVACGDDDSNASDGGMAGQGGAGAPGGGSGGGSGQGDEEGSEGWPCTSAKPCLEGLICAGSPITIDGIPIGVCGMACQGDMQCSGGSCITYTGAAADAHCANIVDEEFGLCGVADTSLCSDDKTCLYLPGAPVGVCVTLCGLDGAPAGDEDAGVGEPVLGGCAAEQACIPDIVTSGEGVCGTIVERGEECGVDIGMFCSAGDICAFEDPTDENSTLRCFQDCSTTETPCEEGTCVIVQGMFAYCI